MRTTVGDVRKIIREILAGSHPDESYDKELADDESLSKKSVYVPDDIKKKIRSWMKDMKLSSK